MIFIYKMYIWNGLQANFYSVNCLWFLFPNHNLQQLAATCNHRGSKCFIDSNKNGVNTMKMLHSILIAGISSYNNFLFILPISTDLNSKTNVCT